MEITPDQFQKIQDLFDEYHFLATDVKSWHGAFFLTNDAAPHRYDGNHARRIRLEQDVSVDDFFEEIERRFGHLPFRSVRTDPFTSPPALEARLLLDGYRAETLIVMATDTAPEGKPADVEIRPVQREAEWEVLPALIDRDESWGQATRADEVYALIRRRGDAFQWFVAWADGKGVGYFSERTKGELGYLEDLFVLPEYRLRGIATALVHRAAESARGKGAQLVFLPTSADDTPRSMYAGLGFKPIYAFRNYLRTRQAS